MAVVPEQLTDVLARALAPRLRTATRRSPDAPPAPCGSAVIRMLRVGLRCAAGIDVDHDRADRDTGAQLTMPTTVLQPDWGAAVGYDAAAVWRA